MPLLPHKPSGVPDVSICPFTTATVPRWKCARNENSPWPWSTITWLPSACFGFFTPGTLASELHFFHFAADGRQPSDDFLDGVTTYDNVSWIFGEGGPAVVPLPPAVWLGSLGILGVIVMRRKLF